MRKLIAIALLMVPTLAAAQETLTIDAIKGRFTALITQRDANANDFVTMAGRLADALAEIDRLKKQGDACKPEPSPEKK